MHLVIQIYYPLSITHAIIIYVSTSLHICIVRLYKVCICCKPKVVTETESRISSRNRLNWFPKPVLCQIYNELHHRVRLAETVEKYICMDRPFWSLHGENTISRGLIQDNSPGQLLQIEEWTTLVCCVPLIYTIRNI